MVMRLLYKATKAGLYSFMYCLRAVLTFGIYLFIGCSITLGLAMIAQFLWTYFNYGIVFLIAPQSPYLICSQAINAMLYSKIKAHTLLATGLRSIGYLIAITSLGSCSNPIKTSVPTSFCLITDKLQLCLPIESLSKTPSLSAIIQQQQNEVTQPYLPYGNQRIVTAGQQPTRMTPIIELQLPCTWFIIVKTKLQGGICRSLNVVLR